LRPGGSVTSSTTTFVWYRWRATLRRRWSGYLVVVLLVGVVGGVGLAAGAAARRTQSSFSTFLASTNPSNMGLVPPPPANVPNFSPALEGRLASLPDVRHVESAVYLNCYALEPDGAANLTSLAGNASIGTVGSVDGLYFNQDRPAVIAGRMANPAKVDEIVMTADAARKLHLHVGSTWPLGLYTAAQQANRGFGTPSVRPLLTIDTHVVGLVVPSSALIRDDVDRMSAIIFTPALTKLALSPALVGAQGWTQYGMQLVHGNADIPRVENEIAHAAPAGTILLYGDVSIIESDAQRAIAPQVIALAAFAVIAALATLLVVTQAIWRLLQFGREDREVMRALGASPSMNVGAAATPVLAAIGAGSILALAVAAGLSPLSPIGPVRSVYPDRGVALDWAVLAPGLAGTVVVLGVVTLLLAVRDTPGRFSRPRRAVAARGSVASRLVASAGLPVPAVEGVRFAMVPGRGRTAVPVRSAMAGAVLAVVILATTLTFGASLATLVARPALYGWNYTYALNSTFGIGSTPASTAATLRHDPKVAAWNSVLFYALELDGHTVPTMLEAPSAAVAPPQLSGHPVRATNQVVLGPATLAELHKSVGDTVVATYTGGRHLTFRIVGTATFPAIGLALHPSLGVGAVLSNRLLGKGLSEGPVCGPQTQLVLVRLRPHVPLAAGLADGRRITAATNAVYAHVPPSAPCNSDSVDLLTVQRPAEIVNYRTMGSTASELGGVLAIAALGALAATLVASVQRRRRDLAILKSLGLRRRQLAATVAWQASVTMGVGVVVGAPLGALLGRWLWTIFARAIYVVPEPTVPWASILLVAVGAMIFANLAAMIPGRIAATTPTAIVLRTE
ncbi:MAG: FtsX-like permease family protein, partial [Acidimicrobiales bacterium]